MEKARTVNITFEFFTRNQWFFKNGMAQRWVAQAKKTYGTEPNTVWIDKNPFNVDITDINWKQYYTNFAIGLRAINLNEDLVLPTENSVKHNTMSLTTDRIYNWDDDHHVISFPGIMPDITWSYAQSPTRVYKTWNFWPYTWLNRLERSKAKKPNLSHVNRRKPDEMREMVFIKSRSRSNNELQ